MPGRWAFKIDGREIDPANGCSLRGKREIAMPFYKFWGAEWQKVMGTERFVICFCVGMSCPTLVHPYVLTLGRLENELTMHIFGQFSVWMRPDLEALRKTRGAHKALGGFNHQ